MFLGITITNGGGSARKGAYKDYSDEEMMIARHTEQKDAAKLGKYSAQFQLNYKSRDIKGPHPLKEKELVQEIYQILFETQPKTIYVHNPFDKHETHNAVTRATIEALRLLPPGKHPGNVYGCEVWRGLDWVPDDIKIPLDISNYIELQRDLIDCHDSQIKGSKNYTKATIGREFANATYSESHELDSMQAATYAINLRPFMDEPDLTMGEFTCRYIEAFQRQLSERAKIYEPKSFN
ncbi:MAG: PIG-L deacetylase family protein [Alphaproteobacteria bacterium]